MQVLKAACKIILGTIIAFLRIYDFLAGNYSDWDYEILKIKDFNVT